MSIDCGSIRNSCVTSEVEYMNTNQNQTEVFHCISMSCLSRRKMRTEELCDGRLHGMRDEDRVLASCAAPSAIALEDDSSSSGTSGTGRIRSICAHSSSKS